MIVRGHAERLAAAINSTPSDICLAEKCKAGRYAEHAVHPMEVLNSKPPDLASCKSAMRLLMSD